MPPKPTKTKETAKAVLGGAKKKNTAKGYQKPVPIPNGEIITDLTKQQWKVGPSIGSGGFGEIYSASKVGGSSKDYNYVVKIEPHGNGPLFVEMHFYTRNAKLTDIESFRKERKLKSLGMPHFIGSGSHDLNGLKHRFVVMPRYGRDVWSFFLENGKKLPQPAVYRIAIQMLDVLQYIHRCTYVHADLKGANILLGTGKTGTSQAYLVDFGLVSHYTTKDFKPDPKKMHNGTIEYTSRDAHNGVPTMRSDMEILAYNIIHWSGITLPWEEEGLLEFPKKVQESKEKFMANVIVSLRKCFPDCPDVISNYLKYVATLQYNDNPDYDKCRQMFESALKKLGESNSGELKLTLSPTAGPSNKSPTKKSHTEASKKRSARRQPIYDDSENDFEAKEVENKSPSKKPSLSRKRTIAKDATPLKNIDDKRPKIVPNVVIGKGNSSSTQPASVQETNSERTPKSKKNSKRINVNLALDFSIDTEFIINVTRRDKEHTAKESKGNDDENVISIDEDVIPASNENTPVAKVRVLKKKITTSKKTPRKSPR